MTLTHALARRSNQNNSHVVGNAATNNMTTPRDHLDDGSTGTGGGGWWEQPVSDSQHNRRKRLVLLHHAAKCPTAEGRCKIAHCSAMKRVWKHIATCTCKGDKCDFPHCNYSRVVLSHYRRCKDQSCVVCGPVRDADEVQKVNKKRKVSTAGFNQDNTSCCRLCLQEGDEPLVRDCSCRGRRGFTHLSCIVEEAQNKSRQAPAWNRMMATREAFNTCPICNEEFQNDVRNELLKARVIFAEREFKTDHMLYLHAMVDRMRALIGERSESEKAEGEEMCTKMLTVIEEIRRTSTQNNAFMLNIATAYSVMGSFSSVRAEEYHEKSREIMEQLKEVEIEAMTFETKHFGLREEDNTDTETRQF